MTIDYSEICENNASASSREFTGAGLYNTGQVFLRNQSVLRDNHGPHLTGSSIYNGGTISYILPAPLGHYLTGVSRCEQL